ncbi:MAG: hypothetical protein ACP6IP_08160 [Candidatus Njordarchaeia archaeon]
MKESELEELLIKKTSTASYRLYLNALKKYGFVTGEKTYKITRPKNFLEFREIIIKNILESYGSEVVKAIGDLKKYGIRTTPEVIKCYLEKEGLTISLYKIRLILRHLTVIGYLGRHIGYTVNEIKRHEDIIKSFLKNSPPMSVEDLIKTVQHKYDVDESLVLNKIFSMIKNKEIQITYFPHDLRPLILLLEQNDWNIVYENKKLVLSTSKLKSESRDLIEKISGMKSSLLRKTRNCIEIDRKFLAFIKIYLKIGE